MVARSLLPPPAAPHARRFRPSPRHAEATLARPPPPPTPRTASATQRPRRLMQGWRGRTTPHPPGPHANNNLDYGHKSTASLWKARLFSADQRGRPREHVDTSSPSSPTSLTHLHHPHSSPSPGLVPPPLP
ncbi:hypothetical protein E2C01_086674 [Portunus trituberculatus]|uniref:Uncharacterized protein n=1 Tax=Portunus trituberculatus TaxID=210409 RepID=A0A5B7JH24_PORTR|nr:hypothetical protein [Portunus trituberculatus]